MKKLYVFFFMFLISLNCGKKPLEGEIRESALAGKWYTANPKKLAAKIDVYLSDGERGIDNLKILVVPHAGYRYSGATAGKGYSLLKGQSRGPFILIAPSHRARFSGCSVPGFSHYRTPLGNVKVNGKIRELLLQHKNFASIESAHKKEHAVEIQLPFLQRAAKKSLRERGFVPILVGDIDDNDAEKIAAIISKVLRDYPEAVVIISTDFTHYGRAYGYVPFNGKGKVLQKKIKNLDMGAINRFIENDFSGFSKYIKKTGITVCGRNALKIAMKFPVKKRNTELLAYTASGEMTGDWSMSVSYAALAVSEKLKGRTAGVELTKNDKKFLLDLAKRQIESALDKKESPDIDKNTISSVLRRKNGAFVTLKKNGRLRGCIGYVQGVRPLYKAVMENAYNAAFRDPRFPPLRKDELPDIAIEISVLSVPGRISSIHEIQVGTHGLIIEKGGRKGLLLPQVPVEYKWDRNTFLGHTCRKAGLRENCWKNREVAIYSFTADVFHEGEFK